MLRLIFLMTSVKKLVRTFRIDIDALNTSISFYGARHFRPLVPI